MSIINILEATPTCATPCTNDNKCTATDTCTCGGLTACAGAESCINDQCGRWLCDINLSESLYNLKLSYIMILLYVNH